MAVTQQGQLSATGFASAGDDLRHFAQWDGRSWTVLGTGFRTGGNSLVVDAGGRLYTETLKDSVQGAATAIMRWDGGNWTDITADFNNVVDTLKPGRISSNVPVTALAVDTEDNLYAGGMFYHPTPDQSAELPMGYVAMWNGEGWTALGEGFDKVNNFALAAREPEEVYVSGEQLLTLEGRSSHFAKWDGAAWTPIDAGNPDVGLHLASDQSGGLYAAGQRSTGGAFVDYWNRTAWTSIADGFAGEAPAAIDMVVAGDGHLCVGGSFESVDDTPARNIACWDGVQWHALADGVSQRVQGLAFDTNEELYAVGHFTEAGGKPASHIARWDGSDWHALE